MAVHQQNMRNSTRLEYNQAFGQATLEFAALKEDLSALAASLDIDITQFNKIPTVALKKQALNKHRIQKELDIIGSRYLVGVSAEKCEQKLKFVQLAHERLVTSEFANQTTSNISVFSRGLHDWYVRSPGPDKIPDETTTKSKRLSVNFLEAKDDGVEPGYKAFFNQVLYSFLIENFPDDNERWRVIEAHFANPQSLYETYKKKINKHIIKLVHKHISKNFDVKPDKEDLKRTRTILGLYEKNELIGDIATAAYQYFKTEPAITKNIDAVLEALGNDIARVAGLEVQEQSIYPGTYEQSGVLKLMLMAKWVDNANILKPLAGTTNFQYRVREVVSPTGDIKYLAKNDIKHFAQYLPLFIIQGDNDAIGSRGQNKIVVDGKLIGIDFGHAYKKNIVSKVRADFTINDAEFKNYSVFHDAPRSDIIRGLLILARLKGKTLSDEVINSYGPEFVTMINNITPRADEKIFEDYINFFTDLTAEFPDDSDVAIYNRKCCADIVDKLQAIKVKAIDNARDTFINKFAHYLNLPKSAVDLLQNIEKAIAGPANTTLRAGDNNEVLLNHIRIKNPVVTNWDTIVKDGKYTFNATFVNNKEAIAAATTLSHYLADHEDLLDFDLTSNTITFSFNGKNLKDLSSLFAEERIKSRYHKEDYKLYYNYVQESKLGEQLQCLSEFGLDSAVSQDPTGRQYIIALKRNENDLDPYVMLLLKNHFNVIEYDGFFEIKFPTAELKEVIKKVTSIPFEIKRENNIKEQQNNFKKTCQHIHELLAKNDTNDPINLERNSDDHLLFKIPSNWDPIFLRVIKNRLSQSDYRLNQHNQYIIGRNELTEFNTELQQAWEEYDKLIRAINKEIQLFNRLEQYFNGYFKMSPDKPIDLTLKQEGDRFVFSLSFDNLHPILRNMFHENGINKNKYYEADHLAELTATLETIYREFCAVQRITSEKSITFASYAEGIKAQHNIDIKLIDNGYFTLEIENDPALSFTKFIKSKLENFLDNGFFKVSYQNLDEFNEAFLLASFEYGESKAELESKAALIQLNKVLQRINQHHDASHSLIINARTIFNHEFGIIITANRAGLNLESLLPEKDSRNQYNLSFAQLIQFTDQLEKLNDAHLIQLAQAEDEKRALTESIESKTQDLLENLTTLNQLLERPGPVENARFFSLSSFTSVVKQTYYGTTPVSSNVRRDLMPHLDLDKLKDNKNLSQLSQLLILRLKHVEVLITTKPATKEEHEKEKELLEKSINQIMELMILHPDPPQLSLK